MNYMEIINRAPSIGLVGGGLLGATSRGQAYTNPVTGERFYEEIGPVGRVKRVLGGSIQGGLGGLTLKGGTHLVRSFDPSTSLETIKNKVNYINQ